MSLPGAEQLVELKILDPRLGAGLRSLWSVRGQILRHRIELRLAGDALPELPQSLARSGAAAGGVAVSQHHGIHGAGAGAADCLDADSFVFQQPVEHPPGKRAVRAAALEGERYRPVVQMPSRNAVGRLSSARMRCSRSTRSTARDR